MYTDYDFSSSYPVQVVDSREMSFDSVPADANVEKVVPQ
jgi:hypothetical protein